MSDNEIYAANRRVVKWALVTVAALACLRVVLAHLTRDWWAAGQSFWDQVAAIAVYAFLMLRSPAGEDTP